jgi:Copper type II ascorbate-dependent monooxygenase, N-terminal domain
MNSGGAPPGTDVALGFVGGACPAGCINDYFTVLYDAPKLDTANGGASNTVFVAGEQAGPTMRVEFTRPLAATDAAADRAVSASSPTTFLWALHESITPTTTSAFPKHTRRGSVTFNLADSSACPAAGTGVQNVVDIDVGASDGAVFSTAQFEKEVAAALSLSADRVVVDNVENLPDVICPACTRKEFRIGDAGAYTVPGTADTTYTCAGFALDQQTLDRVVAFEALPDNQNVIHHLVMYQIAAGAPAPNLTHPQDCSTQMPVGAQPLYAWAPGGGPVLLPSQAEVRLGGSTGVHYRMFLVVCLRCICCCLFVCLFVCLLFVCAHTILLCFFPCSFCSRDPVPLWYEPPLFTFRHRRLPVCVFLFSLLTLF